MRLRLLSFLFFPLVALPLLHCGSSSRSGFGDQKTDPSGANGPGFDNGDAGKAPDAQVAYDKCKVPPDGDNGGGLECTKSSPPNSFTPHSKWTWSPPGGGTSSSGGLSTMGSMVTPLVGNFTDDNGDGVIDLCDTPDVIVTTGGGGIGAKGKIWMLAGDTGKLEVEFEGDVDASVNPAFGDLDGDGVPEVVANDSTGAIVVYGADGKVKWRGTTIGKYRSQTNSYCHAIAIYDLDADGSPEIIAAFEVFDKKGKLLFGHDVSAFQGQYWCPANTAADLDGDGKLEVIFGNAAYHHDGTPYWTIPGPPGQPQVANLDGDTDPEIFIARQDGILVLEHDGKIKFGPIKLVQEANSPQCWSKPGAVHDFDGDGIADLSASTCTKYGVYTMKPNGLDLLWSATVDDNSGLASTTAFDFLGGGIAQAVYGDQKALYVFDGKKGTELLNAPRSSGTLIEYPVVADIDNDQSADILVVSNTNGVGTYKQTIEAIEDEQKRWIPTRRVWNQHAYHVTNVREDGTIPKVMPKSWQRLNTFRTNAQIQGNGDCAPPPANPPK